MINEERKKLILFKFNIKKYIDELNCIFKNEIKSSDLLSLNQSQEILSKCNYIDNKKNVHTYSFKILFKEKDSDRFINYLHRLYEVNCSNVFYWSNLTNICGLYLAESILQLDSNFNFNCNNGIFNLISSDFKDQIEFLFFEDEDDNNKLILELTVKGINWSKIEWEFDYA